MNTPLMLYLPVLGRLSSGKNMTEVSLSLRSLSPPAWLLSPDRSSLCLEKRRFFMTEARRATFRGEKKDSLRKICLFLVSQCLNNIHNNDYCKAGETQLGEVSGLLSPPRLIISVKKKRSYWYWLSNLIILH